MTRIQPTRSQIATTIYKFIEIDGPFPYTTSLGTWTVIIGAPFVTGAAGTQTILIGNNVARSSVYVSTTATNAFLPMPLLVPPGTQINITGLVSVWAVQCATLDEALAIF